MDYNPLLDTFTRPRTWWEIAEELQERIVRTARKRGNDAAYHLNVLDLIDDEAAAYWREWGVDVYGDRPYAQPKMAHRYANGANGYEAAPDQSFEGISII